MKSKLTILICAAVLLIAGAGVRQAEAVTAFDVSFSSTAWWYNHCHGLEFTTTAPITVTDLGTFDYLRDGLSFDVPMAIYDYHTQQLLAQVTVPAGSGTELTGDFRYAPLIDPLSLPANGRYMLAGNIGDYLMYPPTQFFPNSPSVEINTTYTYISWEMTSGLFFPPRQAEVWGGYQHALNLNFKYTEGAANSPVPEPASMVLMLSGLVCIGGWTLKKKK